MDGARDFRLMRRNMVESILSMNEYNRLSKGILGWVGFKTFWLSYENIERVAGETKHRPHFIISESNKDFLVSIR